MFERVLELIFPPRCAYCGQVIPRSSQGICDKCEGELVYNGELCVHCGKPKSDCECHGRKKSEYLALISPFTYTGLARSAVLRLKNKPTGAPRLAGDIVKFVSDYYGSVPFDFVTFVPASSERVSKKGFNHAKVLAEEVAKLLDLPCESVLCKLYNTVSQHSSSSSTRAGNVRGVFDCSEPERVRGKTVLLIDDVSTTGATLNECALMLNLYGADSVYAATVAVATGD